MDINLKQLKDPGFSFNPQYITRETTKRDIEDKVKQEIKEGVEHHLEFLNNLEKFAFDNGFLQKLFQIDSTKQEEWDMVMEFERMFCEEVVKTIYDVKYGELLDVYIIYKPITK